MNRIFFTEISPKEIKYFPAEDFKRSVRDEICKGKIDLCPSQILRKEHGDWDKGGDPFEQNGYWKNLTSFLTDFSSVDRHDTNIIKALQNHSLYEFESKSSSIRKGNEISCKNYNKLPVHVKKRLMSPLWGNEEGTLTYEEFIVKKIRGFLGLYHSIKDNGFLREIPNPEFDEVTLSSANPLNYGPINISMGRDKNFLQNNGFHRLAVCQFLDIDKIPVKVLVIHEDRYEQEKSHITECAIP